VSLKGERHSNEDKHNIILNMNNDNATANVNFYGVYDGHGGKFVSNFLRNNLPQYFTNPKVSYPLNKNYVNKVYDLLENTLKTKYTKQATECGSTCLAVCNYKSNDKQYLNIMNTGDSRCVLCRNNIGIALTKDHKPNWIDERRRISKLGGNIRRDGTVYRINDLSVSRAFGDLESSKYVTHRPELYKYTVKPKSDRFMIVACDGLWDVVSSQDAVNFVLDNCYDVSMNRINHKMNISRKLAEYAISMDSGDNVTCIVVFFD
jgi:protein phosphatase 2C family protein 2/3